MQTGGLEFGRYVVYNFFFFFVCVISPTAPVVRGIQNLAEAAVWFERAGESGVPQALQNLGKMYEMVRTREERESKDTEIERRER